MHRRGAQALFALKKEKYMNQIDREDPCELLRTAGFTHEYPLSPQERRATDEC
jgi:hypothetical protein